MSIDCLFFKSHQKGHLQGFASFWIPKMGIEIRDCTVYMKNGARWVNLPTKEYIEKGTGEKKHSPVLKFREDSHYKMFSKKALEAIDVWCLKNSQEKSKNDVMESGD